MTGGRRPERPEDIRPGLDRILAAFERTLHPERAFRTFHIAGTNGKGSTASFIESVLRRLSAGPVGLYTSPHLISPEERIRVDGEKIPRNALDRFLGKASKLSDVLAGSGSGPLSYFEEMTWAACCWFRERKARHVVMEAGLGGRWDATNACEPEVSVITTVGIDHREWLGETLERIASEKAGILRPGIPAILGRLRPVARAVIVRTARERGAPAWELGRDFGWEEGKGGRVRFRLPGIDIPGTRLGMAGEFQRDNAALACAALWRIASSWGVTSGYFARATREGLAAARWPGRLSRLPGRGNARVWTDGAHNQEAARALSRELAKRKECRGVGKIIALWSMLREKDFRGFLQELSGVVDGWVIFRMEHERAADVKDLSLSCRAMGCAWRTAADFLSGMKAAREWAGPGGQVIVCGSLAAVGEAYRLYAGDIP